MTTTALDRNTLVGLDRIQALAPGITEELTVETSAAYAFVQFAAVPTAATLNQRVRIVAGVPEYFKVQGGHKCAAKVGSTADVSLAFASLTTVVRVLYDEVAGVVEMTECA